MTGEFHAQRDSDVENVSIWWRHHVSSVINTDNILIICTYCLFAAFTETRTACTCPTECNLTSFPTTPSVASLSNFGVSELLNRNNERVEMRLVGRQICEFYQVQRCLFKSAPNARARACVCVCVNEHNGLYNICKDNVSQCQTIITWISPSHNMYTTDGWKVCGSNIRFWINRNCYIEMNL